MSENTEVTATTEATLNPEKRGKEVTHVDPRQVVRREGHNVRFPSRNQSFLDLKANIKEIGVTDAIPVYRDTIDGQKVFVVRGSGNTRMRAVEELLAEGHEIARVPVLISKKEDSTEEADLLQMLTSNMGQPLSILEKGIAFLRLEKNGYTRAEIQQKASVSATDVSNGIRLAGASKMIQNHIGNGLISPNVVLAIFRQTDDPKERDLMVLKAIETAEERTQKAAAEAEAEAKAAAEQVAARLAAQTPEGEVKKVNGRGRPKKEVTAVVATTPKKPTVKAKDVVGLSAKTPMEKMKEAVSRLESMEVENEGVTLLKALIGILETRKSSPMDIVNLISPAAPVVVEESQLVDALKGETPEDAPAESAETTQEQEA